MKRKNILKITAIITLSFLINLNVLAAQSSKKSEEIIKSCVDDQTFAVIRVDIEKLNLDAFVEMALKFVKTQEGHDIEDRVQAEMDELQNFGNIANTRIKDLLESGAKECFVVFSMYDFPYFFVAFQSGNNQASLSQKITKLMDDFNVGKLDLYSLDGLILVGLEQTIARLKTIQPVESKVISNAFKACGDTAIQVVLFPSPDQRKVITEMIPQVSFNSENIDLTVFGNYLEWAALGIDGPPSISLKAAIQSQSSQGADNILEFIKNLYSLIEQNPDMEEIKPQLSQLLKNLVPEKQEKKLVLDIEPKKADSIINDIIIPSFLRVREIAARVACGTNLSGIGKALLLYANDYEDKLPPNLEILTWTQEMPPKGLICPSTRLSDSYIYRGAGLTTSDVPYLVMVYDKKGNHIDGRNVLYMDSHFEFVSEERFLELIAADNKYRKEKGYPGLPAK